MQNLFIAMTCWFATSVAFGALWSLSGAVLKGARQRSTPPPALWSGAG